MAPTTRNVSKEKPKANTETTKQQATTSRKKRKTMTVLSASVRGEDVTSAIDTALLEDVLKGNGEGHLFDKIKELAEYAEDDPPVIFGWKNVGLLVQAIQAAEAQAAAPGGLPLPPCPLALPAAGVNSENFKEAVLEYARIPGAPARLDTACLPCTQEQYGKVIARLTRLDLEPWIQRIIDVRVPNSPPIAHVYVPRPRTITLDRATEQFPNSLWG